MAVDILAIAENAKKAKALNPKVIDATLGMFYDENKKLVIPYIEEQFYKLKVEDIFPYGATSGGDVFKKNIVSWLFYQIEEKMRQHFTIDAIATPGGSGALSIIFNSYGLPGESVLISEPRWRYEFFTDAAKLNIDSYQFFEDNQFNINGLKNKINELSLKQKRIIVVINDPCHNPTGYQLTNSEWDELIKLLNTFKENEIILVLDIAYADYNPDGFEEQRKKYLKLEKLENHVTPLLTFSASKSFSIYGIRLGGLIGLFKTKEQEDYFNKNAYKDALGKWSTAPTVGVALFNQIMENKEIYIPQLKEVTDLLRKRGELFLKKAKELNLDHYPYSGGFFTLIKTKTPLKDYELLTKRDVYVVPMEEGLRVALCSIALNEVSEIVEKINKVINK